MSCYFSIIIPNEILSHFDLKFNKKSNLMSLLQPKWPYLSQGDIFLRTIATASVCNTLVKSAEVSNALLLL
jgi:hypothetical protein